MPTGVSSRTLSKNGVCSTVVQKFDLLLGGERREGGCPRMRARHRRLELGEPCVKPGRQCAKKDPSARSMKKVTPASRAPGVASLGMICEVSASTSAASPAPNKV